MKHSWQSRAVVEVTRLTIPTLRLDKYSKRSSLTWRLKNATKCRIFSFIENKELSCHIMLKRFFYHFDKLTITIINDTSVQTSQLGIGGETVRIYIFCSKCCPYQPSFVLFYSSESLCILCLWNIAFVFLCLLVQKNPQDHFTNCRRQSVRHSLFFGPDIARRSKTGDEFSF